MQRFLIFTAIFCLFRISNFAQAPADTAKFLLQKLVSDGHVIGATAGIMTEGEIAWQSAVGYADEKQGEAFTIATITRTASIAKSMTAIAVMQLYEQSLIDLDVPIQTYLPDFPKKPEGDITVRQLLAHTSGIKNYKNAKEIENQTHYPTLTAAVDVFKDRELNFKPGESFSYASYNYVVLGLIIERVSGTTFENYMQKNIWAKAGMTNTSVEKLDENVPNKSLLYHKSKRGKIKQAKPNDLSNRVPGGGFQTTLGDMLHFGNAVIENKLIKASTLELMTQIHSLEKEGNPYGFGWFLYGPKPDENLVIGHSGEQTGAATQLMIIPKNKTVIVVFANTSRSWQEIVGLSVELTRLFKR